MVSLVFALGLMRPALVVLIFILSVRDGLGVRDGPSAFGVFAFRALLAPLLCSEVVEYGFSFGPGALYRHR